MNNDFQTIKRDLENVSSSIDVKAVEEKLVNRYNYLQNIKHTKDGDDLHTVKTEIDSILHTYQDLYTVLPKNGYK